MQNVTERDRTRQTQTKEAKMSTNNTVRSKTNQIETKGAKMSETMTEKQMFPLTATLKDQLGKYAAEHDQSVAEVIRQAIADKIGVKLEQTTQRRKYQSEAERIEAQRARTRAKRDLVRQLLSDYNKTH
jgi:hypothetical protein